MINLLKFPKHSTLKITNRNLVGFKDFFGGDKSEAGSDFNDDIEVTQVKQKTFAGSDTKKDDSNKLSRVKSYNPLFKSVENDIKKLTKEVFKQDFNEATYLQLPLSDPLNKFNLLTKCISNFGHDISNTVLNDIKSVADLQAYYETEVKDTSPLQDLKSMENLPPNIHINMEYNRFDPATDTFFNGRDAYRKRDTIVSSLWYSKKYKSVIKKNNLFTK